MARRNLWAGPDPGVTVSRHGGFSRAGGAVGGLAGGYGDRREPSRLPGGDDDESAALVPALQAGLAWDRAAYASRSRQPRGCKLVARVGEHDAHSVRRLRALCKPHRHGWAACRTAMPMKSGKTRTGLALLNFGRLTRNGDGVMVAIL